MERTFSIIKPDAVARNLQGEIMAMIQNAGLRIVDSQRSAADETWAQPWGEVKNIRDHHNELRVRLADGGEAPRELIVVFRAFDDGVGFRYEFPEQPHLDERSRDP